MRLEFLRTCNKIFSKSLWGVSSCFFISLLFSYNSFSESISEISSYNAVFFGDFESPYYSSMSGTIAVKGNMHINNYGLATGVNPHDSGISVIVGGDMNFKYGKIYGGDIIIGGSSDNVGSAVIYGLNEDQMMLDEMDVPFDFDESEYELMSFSNELSKKNVNTSIKEQWGGLYFEGDCHSDLQVFEIDGLLLDSSHTIKLNCIPDNADILINVSGELAGISNVSLGDFKNFANTTIINFFEASVVTFSSVGIYGMVLAPKSHVKNPTGSLKGSVFAASWSGPMSLTWVPYHGKYLNYSGCLGFESATSQ